eukprot:gene19841-25790_t
MSKRRNMLYVGGLDSLVNEEVLHAAFIPFGELKSVQVVKDFIANKSRGFGFVEYDLDDDASDAIDNMDGSELFGKVIRCSIAKPPSTQVQPGQAVWSAEEWIQNSLKENDNNNIIDDNDDIKLDSLIPKDS